MTLKHSLHNTNEKLCNVNEALHQQASEVLRSWHTTDDDQAFLRDEYLAFLDKHTNGHLKACDYGHLTASSLIVDPHLERVLLTLHPKVSRWLQTGGHLEPTDSSIAESAGREACEESGISNLVLSPTPVRLDKHVVPCRPGVMLHHFDVQYVAVAPKDAHEVISSESLDLAWFGWDELPEVDDSVLNLVQAAKNFLQNNSI